MYLHLIDIFSCIDRRFIIERGNKYDILFSFSMVEGRGQNTANKSREGNYGCHVTVYKFALGLFGLQIDFIGSLQRIDCCGQEHRLHAASCFFSIIVNGIPHKFTGL